MIGIDFVVIDARFEGFRDFRENNRRHSLFDMVLVLGSRYRQGEYRDRSGFAALTMFIRIRSLKSDRENSLPWLGGSIRRDSPR
jgi:hypothetical protein